MPRGRRLKAVDSSAEEEERLARIARSAYVMRRSGMSLFDIAEQLQVTEDVITTGIRMTISKATRMITEQTASELLDMELDRLDSMQHALWTRAMDGDARAVDSILKIIDKRTNLLGIDHSRNESNTVVIAGDSQAYTDALKALVARKELEA